MAQLHVRELGEYIREQRNGAQISLRQLARLAGVSNPYLSQIERGLRKPSAEILQQIAKALRISAEALYVQAGILEAREGHTDVLGAVVRDPALSERQKQVLLEVYESFRKENDAKAETAAVEAATTAVQARKPTRRPRAAAKAATPSGAAAQRSASTTARTAKAAARRTKSTAARRAKSDGSGPTPTSAG
jgi:transcriptional regulator with XRE-family HTH domain